MKLILMLTPLLFSFGTFAQSFETISGEEFSEKLKTGGVVLIDVRTPGEFEKGHIPNAINIDFLDDSFPVMVGEFDKNKVYLIYCKAGGRSEDAGKEMESMGFKKVYDLQNGFDAWQGEKSEGNEH